MTPAPAVTVLLGCPECGAGWDATADPHRAAWPHPVPPAGAACPDCGRGRVVVAARCEVTPGFRVDVGAGLVRAEPGE